MDRWPALEAVPGDETAFFCNDAAPFYELIPLADEGKVYLQNASSLYPPLALDPQPGERVLDVAAAPGGKAFNIAAKIANTGELWLNDAVKPRLDNMAALAETYHVRHHSLTDHKAQYLDKFLPHDYFDRILVDAQCTGEGRFDLRKRNALQHWSEDRVRSYTHAQTKMLSAAYRLLKPGGTIVYSTCTIAPEENELPVHKVLRASRRPRGGGNRTSPANGPARSDPLAGRALRSAGRRHDAYRPRRSVRGVLRGQAGQSSRAIAAKRPQGRTARSLKKYSVAVSTAARWMLASKTPASVSCNRLAVHRSNSHRPVPSGRIT